MQYNKLFMIYSKNKALMKIPAGLAEDVSIH